METNDQDAEKMLGEFLEVLYSPDFFKGATLPSLRLDAATARVDGLREWWNNWKRKAQAERARLRGNVLAKLTREEAESIGVLTDWQAFEAIRQLSDAVNGALKRGTH
jgi:uncharacterized protein (DUF2252 family)